MSRTLSWLFGLLVLVFAAGNANAYQNPARGIQGLGDPSVLHHNGVYYLYASTGGIGVNNDIGSVCWSSTDLVTWKPESWAFLVTPESWMQYGIETPHVIFRSGKFYMFVTGKNKQDGLLSVCLAESDSPTGPFKELVAPMVSDSNHVFDPYVYEDTDGRTYLYYTTIRNGGYNSLNVWELSPDLRSKVGKPVQDVLAHPYQPWEYTSLNHWMVEGAHIHKRNGVYYLIYSGSFYLSADYAVGYATGPSPVGPFTRYEGNPILKSDLPNGVSGPGTGHIVDSPDGTELFYLYNAATDPTKDLWDRSLYIDRVSFTPEGVLQIHGPTKTCQADPSRGGAGSPPEFTCPEPFEGIPTVPITPPSGWLPVHSQVEGFAWTGINTATNEVVAHVTQDPYLNRRTGVMTALENWLPYSEIGPDNYVRAKFAIYRANQKDPNDLTQVPNIRVRASTRFAYGNVLEVYHHLAADPASEPILREMVPSADPERPSVYTVDFDPIDVPALANTPGEGVMRVFEAYALEPQENGDLVLAESSIGTYPRSVLPDADTPDVLKKVYAPGPDDAGDLKSVFATDLQLQVQVIPLFEGFRQLPDTTGIPLPTYREGSATSVDPPPGITLDTTHIPSTRLGVAVRDFFPGADRTADDYVRVEPGRQYKIRWHLTSTVPANLNGNIRLRARTLKWGWNYKTEIGGAYAAGDVNNLIAQQVLPGVGSLNPDKIANENGGWYTQLIHVPMDPDIRADAPDGTPLEERMPLMMAEPGPGIDAPSLLDLKLGVDLLDTLDFAKNYELEIGNVTVDRIEIRSYPRVLD